MIYNENNYKICTFYKANGLCSRDGINYEIFMDKCICQYGEKCPFKEPHMTRKGKAKQHKINLKVGK